MSTAKTIALHKALGGGSESGGGAGVVVTFTTRTGNTLTADKTFEEVYEAIENGSFAYAKYLNNVYLLDQIYGSNVRILDFTRPYIAETPGLVGITRITWREGGSLYYDLERYYRDSVALVLSHDDDSSYADPPNGSLSVYESSGAYGTLAYVYDAMQYVDSSTTGMRGSCLINGDIGGRIDRYEPVSANVENAGEENETITIVFQTIGIRNGSVLLKRVTVSGGPWDSLDDASVTYSETAL